MLAVLVTAVGAAVRAIDCEGGPAPGGMVRPSPHAAAVAAAAGAAASCFRLLAHATAMRERASNTTTSTYARVVAWVATLHIQGGMVHMHTSVWDLWLRQGCSCGHRTKWSPPNGTTGYSATMYCSLLPNNRTAPSPVPQ